LPNGGFDPVSLRVLPLLFNVGISEKNGIFVQLTQIEAAEEKTLVTL